MKTKIFSDKRELKPLVTADLLYKKYICWQQTYTVRNARTYSDGKEMLPDGTGILGI